MRSTNSVEPEIVAGRRNGYTPFEILNGYTEGDGTAKRIANLITDYIDNKTQSPYKDTQLARNITKKEFYYYVILGIRPHGNTVESYLLSTVMHDADARKYNSRLANSLLTFAKVGINKYFGLTVNEWLDLTMLEQQTYAKVADVLSKEKISLVNNILNGPDMELG